MPLTRPSSAPVRPSASAPASGIFKVTHRGHRGDHFVCVIKGDVLPYCRGCGDGVRFELWCEADYVEHDWDFGTPRLHLVKSSRSR